MREVIFIFLLIASFFSYAIEDKSKINMHGFIYEYVCAPEITEGEHSHLLICDYMTKKAILIKDNDGEEKYLENELFNGVLGRIIYQHHDSTIIIDYK
ncbi:hypothetical protein ACHCAL_16825 [Providencia huaxiensis]|uniref:hypothetical protein n=1 Tax=Providencia huaxiensis TaxID=2027290 RepID=UPI0037574F0E